MSDKFNNKYRIASARWKDWDYGWAAPYFVTICTKDRENFFGEIVNGKMKLSGAGILADVMWYEIKNHSKNVELGEFVVMPNHVHGIVTLYGDDVPIPPVETGPALSNPSPEGSKNSNPSPEGFNEFNHTKDSNDINNTNDTNDTNVTNGANDTNVSNVETRHALSLQMQTNTPAQQRFQNPGKNTLSSIIGSYKSAVTRHANRLQLPTGWQTRFHDHVIRDEKEFNDISAYISNNVSNWEKDKFHNK